MSKLFHARSLADSTCWEHDDHLYKKGFCILFLMRLFPLPFERVIGLMGTAIYQCGLSRHGIIIINAIVKTKTHDHCPEYATKILRRSLNDR